MIETHAIFNYCYDFFDFLMPLWAFNDSERTICIWFLDLFIQLPLERAQP